MSQNARRFCIDFALAVKPTVILGSEPFKLTYPKADGNEKFMGSKLTVSPFDNVSAQLTFSENLSEGDEIFLEMGSGADGFALKCAKTGVRVFRIPPHRVKEYIEAVGDAVADVAASIANLAQEHPELFYEMLEREQDIARVNAAMRMFYFVQRRLRIPTELRTLGIERQLPFLLPDDQRLRDHEEVLRQTALKGIKDVEEFWYSRLNKACQQSEFVRSYLLPIRGVGPRISGMAVGIIGDIRRFDRFPQLKAYAGLSVGHDNKAPRFTRGEHLTFSPGLKNALWNFTAYVIKENGSGGRKVHPLRLAYDDHRQKYEERHPGSPDYAIHNASWRWLATQFLEYIWNAWHHYLSGADPAEWLGWALLNRWQGLANRQTA